MSSEPNIKSGGVSFGFSKTSSQSKKLPNSKAVGEQEIESKKEIDYVLSVDRNTITSTKAVEELKELVIPLITVNKWHNAVKPEELDKVDNVAAPDNLNTSKELRVVKTGDAATDQAVNELLQDASGFRGSRSDALLSVPLLMRNKIPEGFETDDQLNVSLRPDEASEADYEAVPIEQFGLAVLRGMGWKEGQGIGKNNQNVKPVEAQLRPKGLGLGADRSSEVQKKHSMSNGSGKEEEDGEKLMMKKGVHCVVVSRKKDGLYGTVVGLDEDNSRVMVCMGVGRDDIVNLSQRCLKLVSKKEYDKCHKYLNKNKVDKFNEEEDLRQSRDENKRNRGKGHDKDGESGSSVARHSENGLGKRKDEDRRSSSTESKGDHSSSRDRKSKHCKKDDHKDKDTDRHSGRQRDKVAARERDKCDSDSGSSRTKMPAESKSVDARESYWLQPQLCVRIIDKKHMNGKYFKKKVVIEDVVSQDKCICRTAEGCILEDIRQSQLESVVPHDSGACVRIVSGKHRMQLGQLLSRDKTKCTAVVQLLADRDIVLSLSYEQICEHTGNIDEQFDY